ncbi:unnamed protein product [Brassica rapa]|uniref:Uncharacterized protein n=1 Tax=Brassica campestris TaxID=3711 RepID=A0A3P5ZST5_BRACM|nr:unnamed protein product [Brassica rapa]VDC81019.1 unnamed protein product [Brassica rapa]
MAIKVKDILGRVKLISLNQGGAYFNTQGQDSSVILRVKEDHDGAGASGSSVSAINLAVFELRLRDGGTADLLLFRYYLCSVEKASCIARF